MSRSPSITDQDWEVADVLALAHELTEVFRRIEQRNELAATHSQDCVCRQQRMQQSLSRGPCSRRGNSVDW